SNADAASLMLKLFKDVAAVAHAKSRKSKTRSETYIKSKDIDLWQVIQNGDFYFEIEDSKTKMMKEMPYKLLKDDQKKVMVLIGLEEADEIALGTKDEKDLEKGKVVTIAEKKATSLVTV
nr:hypothetical protein [Tanacetum cinerariifolium]